MSVVVFVNLPTKAGQADKLVSLLDELVPGTRAYEGCQEIYLYKNQDDPDNVVMLERWDSRQHYEKYLAWRTETGALDEIGQLLAGDLTIRFLDRVGS